MSRNSGGTYSLPAGNPVVTGTAISSSVMNNTLNDIKTELTDSLCRSGKGGMLAALPLFSGTLGAPGLSWSENSDTGFFYDSGETKYSIDGALAVRFTTNLLGFYGTAPSFFLGETDAPADEGNWRLQADSGNLYLYALNDALNASSSPLVIARTGTVIDTISLNATTLEANADLEVDGDLTVNDLDLTPSEGSFTMELATASSGGSVLQSDTAYWKKNGNIVTLRIPTLSGVTTDNSLFLRGIPAAIQPAFSGYTCTQHALIIGYVNGAKGIIGVYIGESSAYFSLEGVSAALDTNSNEKGVGYSATVFPVITYHTGP